MISTYYIYPKALPEAHCDEVIRLGKASGLAPGTVSLERVVDESIRKSDVSFIKKTEETHMLFDFLSLRILCANIHCFQLELDSVPYLNFPAVQFTEYKAEGEQHYDWHRDNFYLSKGKDRKLSLVIQLTDPSEYQGGRLELEDTIIPPDVFSARGDIIVFPSFLRHRVTPVTSGVRHSLVTWAFGPTLR